MALARSGHNLSLSLLVKGITFASSQNQNVAKMRIREEMGIFFQDLSLTRVGSNELLRPLSQSYCPLDIVHPVYPDFYLQSQPGLKGSAYTAQVMSIWD